MSTATLKYFDTYAYIKKSKEFGASEQLAEYQIEQIEQAIEAAVKSVKEGIQAKDMATKGDLKDVELKIEQTKNQIIIWVAGLFVASGLIQHFFK